MSKQNSSVQYSDQEPRPSDFLINLKNQIVSNEQPVKKTNRFNKQITSKWSARTWQFRITQPSRGNWFWRKEVRVKIKWPTWKKWHFSIKISRPKTIRPIFSLLLVFLILILPFKVVGYVQSLQGIKSRVVQASSEGLADLKTASKLLASQEFLAASGKFDQAAASFDQASQDLKSIQSWLWQLVSVVPASKVRLAANAPLIAQAGELSSQLGSDLNTLIQDIVNNSADDGLLILVSRLYQNSQQALVNSQSLNQVIKKINPASLPTDYQNQLLDWQNKLELIDSSLKQVKLWSSFALDLLGEKMDRRYLLVFQNNAEIRASGGFVGSYALLDVKKGEIKNLEIPKGGSYDIDGSLRKLVNPPAALKLVSVHWKFRDANWWPDWPISAQQLAWFLYNSNGPTVDGVISFTPDVLEELLAITGPVDLTEDHGLIITADNFRLTVQDHVEDKISGEDQPKKIIGDLASIILERLPIVLEDQSAVIELTKVLTNQIANRHILLYFNNPQIQEHWQASGWSGQLAELESGQDYLQVVNTNIAGGKTDLKIRQTIEQRVEVQADGSIVNDVTIIREHTGEKQEGLYGVRNVNWLRVYVPQGSKLLSSSGFSQPDQRFFKPTDPLAEDQPIIKNGEGQAVVDPSNQTLIYDELGRTVFANWSMIDPGQTARLNFRYQLPFTLEDTASDNWLSKIKGYFGWGQFRRYRLLIENQAGQNPVTWKVMWRWPKNWRTLWSSSENIVSDQWRSEQISGRQAIGLLFQVKE